MMFFEGPFVDALIFLWCIVAGFFLFFFAKEALFIERFTSGSKILDDTESILKAFRVAMFLSLSSFGVLVASLLFLFAPLFISVYLAIPIFVFSIFALRLERREVRRLCLPAPKH